MNKALIQNIVMYQIAWFVCILGAAYSRPWLASALVLAWVLIHISLSNSPKKEALFIFLAPCIGVVVDQILNNHGYVLYQAHGWSNSIVPIWIIALWLAFASTFSISLRWLQHKTLLCAVLGAIAGPLAYFAAERLGAVTMTAIPNSYLAIALGWGIVFPSLMSLSTRIQAQSSIQISHKTN